jgi:preprotein translocase subunit SecA
MRRTLDRAQLASEDSARSARTLAKEFDVAVARQRDLVYATRASVIGGPPLTRSDLTAIAHEVFTDALTSANGGLAEFTARYLTSMVSYRIPPAVTSLHDGDARGAVAALDAAFAAAVDAKQARLGEIFPKFQTTIVLKAIDAAWVEQVDFLEQLKTVVMDRHTAQHKIEFEYRREAFTAFSEMKQRVRRDIVRLLCLSEIETTAGGGLVIQFA